MSYAWTDARVREALGLRMELVREEVSYASISTDSRTTQDGDLYVALVGERFDGHDFVVDALARGARGAVLSHPVQGDPDSVIYPVDDTLDALGRLAAHRRRDLSVPVIAITGSSGKTTTKDFTAAALSGSLRVHATEGNRNNRIGMPLTLLAVPDDADAVVLELGTNEPGEIRALAHIARPDVAIITTVGASHLEKLGSLEGVFEEKLDLLRALADSGQCVVGDEPEDLAERARAICSDVTVVGWSARADERPRDADVDLFGRYEFAWRGVSVAPALAGRHAAVDALFALVVADILGVAAKSAARGISAVSPAGMRGELRRFGGLTVVVDCYNANPQSVRVALDVLESQGSSSRKVAVLGSMLELGAHTEELHREVLADVLSREVDLIVATGAFADAVAHVEGAAASPRLFSAPGWSEAYPELRARLQGDEVVLLKASRGIAMEGLLELLAADFSTPVEA